MILSRYNFKQNIKLTMTLNHTQPEIRSQLQSSFPCTRSKEIRLYLTYRKILIHFLNHSNYAFHQGINDMIIIGL